MGTVPIYWGVPVTGVRHHGMDWLRIGAFGLLILYHIGMYFVPWGWHVKTAEPLDWVQLPMLATNSWRLALLFLVSGYASAALFAKLGGSGAFARSRSARLLIPLVFGLIVVIPVQPWIELVTQHGYAHGFAHFWLYDYFRFGTLEAAIEQLIDRVRIRGHAGLPRGSASARTIAVFTPGE